MFLSYISFLRWSEPASLRCCNVQFLGEYFLYKKVKLINIDTDIGLLLQNWKYDLSLRNAQKILFYGHVKY